MSSGSDFAIDVAAGAFRFSMRENGLRRNMRALPEKTVKLVNATMQYYAPQVENYAKNNAPWQDQTGNARNGLAARAFREGSNAGIVLYHQVPYGIWLEVKNSGEYAIISPTIDHYGPIVMARLQRILDRVK